MSEETIIPEEKITWDHSCFYVEGKRFFPLIHEETNLANSVLIKVPYLAEKDTLDALEKIASKAVLEKKWIVWELDFSFDKKPLFIQDTSLFFSFGLFMEEFTNKFWPSFKENTLMLIIFRGSIDFASYFIWTEQQEMLYQERLKEYPSLGEKDLRAFFAADVFSEYLQRLCSFLPDTLPVICLLDAGSILSAATLSYLFSKERFGHLLLALKKSPLALSHLVWEEGFGFGGWIGKGLIPSIEYEEARVGVCLPPFEKMTVENIALIDGVLGFLLEKNTHFRILTEGNLHEGWDGIDDLIVISSLLSNQGLRKLRGFIAAGGRIVTVGSSLGLEDEVELTLI